MSDAAPTAARIVILDEDRVFARALAGLLGRDGHDVNVVDGVDAARAALACGAADLLIVDPAALGSRRAAAAWIGEVRQRSAGAATLAVAAHGSIEAAVELTRAGASDYLTKPVADDALRRAVARALGRRRLTGDAATAGSPGVAPPGLGDVLGGDREMLSLFDLVDAVAASKSTVLIVGESGTGKSLLARAIHARSPRAGKPFVELSCGSLPETLLEGELFGHVRGAFTGAVADKRGRFAAADGGTIFLDEINSATPLMQVKLLRVLQERAFEPVGSNQTTTVDARAILATNVELSTLVADGTFRQDLFYCVNVVALRLPPLRERPGDIPLLAGHFLAKYRAETGRQTLDFGDDAMGALKRYPWPGNVRELENAVERAVVLCRKATIGVSDLPESVTSHVPPVARLGRRADDAPATAVPLEVALRAPERRIIEAALKRNAWARQATARELGIDRTTLYTKMRKHGLGRDAA